MIVQNQIKLNKLHKNQQYIIDNAQRFNVLNCGRRFGKNVIIEYKHTISALQGKLSAQIEPQYGSLEEVYRNLKTILEPMIKHTHDMKQIELHNGGRIDFWSLENYNAIRGRRYHLAMINEAAFSRYLKIAWTKAIRPTLIDFKGEAWFTSTPNGSNYFKELADICHQPGWKYFHFTSYDNPYLDPSEIETARFENPELVFRQEYMAEFIDGQGTLLSRKCIKHFDPTEFNFTTDEYDLVMSVDLAISQKETADYTAMCILAKSKLNDNIYIVDIIRDRLTFNDTINRIKQVYEQYNPRVIGIETVAYQTAVFQELIRTTNLPIIALKPDKDKSTRFLPILGRYEHGLVYHSKYLLPEFERELLSFPLGEHDDTVDALSYAYLLANQKIKKPGMYI